MVGDFSEGNFAEVLINQLDLVGFTRLDVTLCVRLALLCGRFLACPEIRCKANSRIIWKIHDN